MSEESAAIEKLIIGWNEYIDLPDWGILGLRTKIDTGAKTSALHVEKERMISAKKVSFSVVLSRGGKRRTVTVTAAISRTGRVRSSTGQYTMRVFVITRMRLGTVEREIELSLVDREEMSHRMLLGRAALKDLFLVDVSHARLVGKGKKRT